MHPTMQPPLPLNQIFSIDFSTKVEVTEKELTMVHKIQQVLYQCL